MQISAFKWIWKLCSTKHSAFKLETGIDICSSTQLLVSHLEGQSILKECTLSNLTLIIRLLTPATYINVKFRQWHAVYTLWCQTLNRVLKYHWGYSIFSFTLYFDSKGVEVCNVAEICRGVFKSLKRLSLLSFTKCGNNGDRKGMKWEWDSLKAQMACMAKE